MSWLLGLFGLCWKSEADEMYRKYLSMEGMASRLELDVARLTANRDSLELTCKLLRSENAVLRELEDGDDDEDDFDDDFDDDDYDEEDEYYDDEDDDE